MGKNRTIPFGYMMQNGVITTNHNRYDKFKQANQENVLNILGALSVKWNTKE